MLHLGSERTRYYHVSNLRRQDVHSSLLSVRNGSHRREIDSDVSRPPSRTLGNGQSGVRLATDSRQNQ